MDVHAIAISAEPVVDRGLRTFTFHYEWHWEDGSLTVHATDIRAYGLEAAQILFAYRVTPPHGVRRQVMIEDHAQAA